LFAPAGCDRLTQARDELECGTELEFDVLAHLSELSVRPGDIDARQVVVGGPDQDQPVGASVKGRLKTAQAAPVGVDDASARRLQTIYNAFEGKPAIVARIADMAIVGDDEPVALVDRPDVQAVRQGTDAAVVVWQWASLCSGIFARFLLVLPIVREAAAAGPAVREQWRNNAVINRYEETKILVAHIATLVELPEGLDIERATDLLWTYASFETAEVLIVERGWSSDDYEAGPPKRSAEFSASREARRMTTRSLLVCRLNDWGNPNIRA